MIKAYVTNLGKYNEGRLIGEWVTFPIDEDEQAALFERIGINKQYEGIFMTDYENDINIDELGEFTSIKRLNEIAEQLDALDDYEIEIVKALTGYGYTVEAAIDAIDDCIYYDNVSSMTEVAEQLVEECDLLHDVPDSLKYYFDYQAYGRDLGLEGTFIFTDNGCIEVVQ